VPGFLEGLTFLLRCPSKLSEMLPPSTGLIHVVIVIFLSC
jgi:hypothetical protein